MSVALRFMFCFLGLAHKTAPRIGLYAYIAPLTAHAELVATHGEYHGEYRGSSTS